MKTSYESNDNNWYWAADGGDVHSSKFIIEKGQDNLFRRVRSEIDSNERCHWMMINREYAIPVELEDMLDLILKVMLAYQVTQNVFMFEAAKIPVFASFLRDARADLCNYVSNPMWNSDAVEAYSDAAMIKLGHIVSRTLGCDEDWF